jgi:hypothetical protein
MSTAKEITDNLIHRAKNLQEFIVEREWDSIPTGIIKYDIKHKQGQLAKIYVHAMSQNEAEMLVDTWFEEVDDES